MLKSADMLRYLVLASLAISTSVGAQPEHVVLVSIDGLAAYELDYEDVELPNLRELIDEGVRAESNETIFPSVTHPSQRADPHVRGHYAIVGDIDTFPVADASSASTKRRERAEPYHGHGYLPSHPRMYTVFIASGAGIREGLRLGHVRNLDVAPTIVRLLGLELPSAAGVAMEEIFIDAVR